MNKELQAFEIICGQSHDINLEQHKEIVKTALERLEKLEKVWEILKNKKVNLYDLNRVEKVNKYNYFCILEEYQELTETEFNLLKEMLK